MKAQLRLRLVLLAVVLATQTGYFIVLLKRPVHAESDNVRYEVGAWNLAQGRGYALPLHGYGGTEDPDVAAWVCTRHPDACAGAEIPAAMYMPGYSVFAAAIYAVVGRSLPALAAANLVLLWLLFILFERVAARWLDRTGYLFAMIVAALYPFIAREATLIMSDHLHAVLWFAALAAFLLLKPGAARGAAFGDLMALATLTRPYSMLVFPVVWLWPSVRRGMQVKRREWLAGLFAFLLPFTIWTTRNYHWFGRVVPFTTGGVGIWLYQTTLEWDYDPYDPKNVKVWYDDIATRFGGLEILSRRAGEMELREAVKRIEEHPMKFVGRLLVHVPKVWISVGSNDSGRSRALPILVTYMGGLLLLGLWGGWLMRHDARWHALLLAIAANWIFLLPFPGEARRTIPLRLPMLLLAGVAVSHAWRWWRSRRGANASAT